ncbi:hypothetical protein FMK64_19320, partial [Klebsiella michiganensis]|nr:hypothetical protein [Klebsiella michiganensis]
AFLTAEDNNKISDSNPDTYFKAVHEAEKDLIFDAAVIDEKLRDGKSSYGEFINQREMDLNDLASKAMTGKI